MYERKRRVKKERKIEIKINVSKKEKKGGEKRKI